MSQATPQNDIFVIIGLGSNLGDREVHLAGAIKQLGAWISKIKQSCVYASPAMLPADAPNEWDLPFLNMAICGTTSLSADALLEKIHNIELGFGRDHSKHWGPRQIDIDILGYGQLVIDKKNIHIPHPGLLERAFTLMPVKDIAPHWIYPRPSMHQGKTIHQIAATLLDQPHDCRLYKASLGA